MPFTQFAGIFIIVDNKLLLIQELPNTKHALKWGPPAGHAEPGETPLETAIRETQEEVGLKIKPDGLVSIANYYRQRELLQVVAFSAHLETLPTIKLQTSEVADYKWVSLEDIQADTFQWRHPSLKDLAVSALTQTPAPLSFLKFVNL